MQTFWKSQKIYQNNKVPWKLKSNNQGISDRGKCCTMQKRGLYFQSISPLGRCFLYVDLSICMFVGLSVCLFTFEAPFNRHGGGDTLTWESTFGQRHELMKDRRFKYKFVFHMVSLLVFLVTTPNKAPLL